jgi:WhiB family redox-sensing transcriptional regulator
MTALVLDYLPAWDGVGLCVGDPDLMYPTGPAELARARATCRACPVLDECRDWVLSIPEYLGPDGIVAGLTYPERERIILSRLPPKQCQLCGETKPLYEFAQNADGRAARRTMCRECAGPPRQDEPIKVCPRCKKKRPTKHFYPNRKNPDGLAAWCKPCFQSLRGTP